MSFLLRNQPFTPPQLESFRANAKRLRPIGEGTSVWHPRQPGAPIVHAVQQVVSLPPDELARWRETYPYDVSPGSDEAPFFCHFTRFRDAVLERRDRDDRIFDPEDAKGQRVLVVLLLFVMLLAVAAFTRIPAPHPLRATPARSYSST